MFLQSFFICLLTAFGFQALAAEPLFKSHRYDDNVERIAESSEWARYLKGISLSDNVRVDFGADVRISREWFIHPDFGTTTNQSQGYWASRYAFHANVKFPAGYRTFIQLKYSDMEGKQGTPGRLDNDYGDVQQIFVDKTWSFSENSTFFARIGRQEAVIGSGRWVGLRDGPNSRITYDGGRIQWQAYEDQKFELFVVRPTEIVLNNFDNQPDQNNLFASLTWTSLFKDADVTVDPYLLYYENLAAKFGSEAGTEERISLGVRTVTRGPVTSDTDIVLQMGEFNDQDIFAYGAATTLRAGTAIPDLQVTLLGSFFTGNGSNGDKLSTFNAAYFKGTYYGWSAQIGHPNLIALQPGIEYQLGNSVKLISDWGFYWRQSLDDVVYRGNGNALTVPSAADDQRYTGSQFNLQGVWAITPLLTGFVEFSHFFEDMDTPDLQDSEFIATRILWKF